MQALFHTVEGKLSAFSFSFYAIGYTKYRLFREFSGLLKTWNLVEVTLFWLVIFGVVRHAACEAVSAGLWFFTAPAF